MTYVADISFGWPTVTGAILKSLGCTGVIGYAGCADTRKNVSKARFQDWLASGLQVSLVIENADDDMANPANGVPQGKALLAAANALGYDSDNCVLWASADFNVAPGSKTLEAVDECMAQFATVVPVAGLYGNSYAIDYSWQSGSAVKWWQSDSASYSNGLSSHAHLQQIYNDPRAKGQPIDINNVIRTPLAFMGEAAPTPKETPVHVIHTGNSNWLIIDGCAPLLLTNPATAASAPTGTVWPVTDSTDAANIVNAAKAAAAQQAQIAAALTTIVGPAGLLQQILTQLQTAPAGGAGFTLDQLQSTVQAGVTAAFAGTTETTTSTTSFSGGNPS